MPAWYVTKAKPERERTNSRMLYTQYFLSNSVALTDRHINKSELTPPTPPNHDLSTCKYYEFDF